MTSYCPECGEQVNEDDQFCFNCGESVGGAPVQGRQPTDTSRHRPADEAEYQRGRGHHTGPGDPGAGGPSGQGPTVPRKNAIDTLRQSLSWLFGFPILIGAFIIVDVIDSMGIVFGPVFHRDQQTSSYPQNA